MTPASRAPGVSSVGMIRATMESTSAAISGVKNSNIGGVADCAELCACCAAARATGQWVATQVAERLLKLLRRKRRRECKRKGLSELRSSWYDRGQDRSNESGPRRWVRLRQKMALENGKMMMSQTGR